MQSLAPACAVWGTPRKFASTRDSSLAWDPITRLLLLSCRVQGKSNFQAFDAHKRSTGQERTCPNL